MSLTDLIIVYLSIGAPFGAVQFVYSSNGPGRRRILRSVAHFTLWPFTLAYALVGRIASGEPLRKPDNSKIVDAYRHVGVKDLLRELEILTLDSSNELSLFEVREILERYAALSLAVSGVRCPDPNLNRDLFSFGSGDSELGAICLSRRNLARLRSHRSKARTDVATLVGVCAPLSRRQQAVRTAQTLFAEIGDDEGVNFLSDFLEISRQPEAAASEILASNPL